MKQESYIGVEAGALVSLLTPQRIRRDVCALSLCFPMRCRHILQRRYANCCAPSLRIAMQTGVKNTSIVLILFSRWQPRKLRDAAIPRLRLGAGLNVFRLVLRYPSRTMPKPSRYAQNKTERRERNTLIHCIKDIDTREIYSNTE